MINVTETAASKVRELLENEGTPEHGLRIQVAAGGCSGLQYRLGFDTERDGDKIIEEHGLRVLVDLRSAVQLDGATLDYVDGLMGAGFRIDNPNAKSTCGCGESFC